MNDEKIKQEIQAKELTAPRITPADIEANIVSEHYFTAWHGAQFAFWENAPNNEPALSAYATGEPDRDGPLGLLTFCVLVLRNGFTVTGESACVSPENFDPKEGKKYARENAIEKLWPLMGYELKTRLSKEQ